MNTYFERYAYPKTLFNDRPDPALKLSVVIPCFNEPDIRPTLDSLNNCLPVDSTEVIIIVNESENEETEVSEINQKVLTQIESWKTKSQPWFKLLVYHLIMPAKDAGVGFARKAGMDEASKRFEEIDNPKGVICCFDADSTCSNNYLTTVYNKYYKGGTPPVGSSIHYEHIFPDDKIHRNGIVQYELHLRYYVNALRLIKYPFAHQTVGSSMVVRSDMYQKIGGMNKRKAGEDFYFLHRLMPSGRYTDITEACIYPSPRISNRVPFGTGKAMGKWMDNLEEEYFTYSLNSFTSIQSLFNAVESIFEAKSISFLELEENVKQFLKEEDFERSLNRILKQSTNQEQFNKQFFAYFDGFKVLKFLHFSRDHYYPNASIIEEAKKLSKILWSEPTSELSPEELLLFYRKKDKSASVD